MNLPAEGSVLPGKACAHTQPCRWLVSLDFDGTLRAEQGPAIDPAFFEEMAKLRAYGVRWGINTGRTLPYLCSELLPCSPTLPDFICTCERYIYLADAGGTLQPATQHNMECERINMQLRHAFQPTLHRTLQVIRTTHPELQWELAATDPLSVEAIDSETMDALMPLLAPLTTPHITIQRAGRYLRFADARFNKGTALAYVCRELGIDAPHLFIMGDGHNDIDAFCRFKGAWCAGPANTHPEVAAWLHAHGGRVSAHCGVLPALQDWFTARVYR